MPRRGPGEGTIFQRKDGRWVAQYSLNGLRRPPIYAHSYQEARAKLTQALRLRDAGRTPTTNRQTVDHFLSHWLENIKAPALRPMTLVGYRTDLQRLRPLIGYLKLKDLTPYHVEKAYAQLGQSLAPATIRHVHTILNQALELAVTRDLIPRNPLDTVTPPRRSPHDRATLTEDQARYLLEFTEGTRWHALLTLLITTGLRLGEALALNWSDLDGRKLTIDKTAHKPPGRPATIGPPKTRNAYRQLTLPATTLAALNAHRTITKREQLHKGPAWHHSDLIFPGTHGQLRSPNDISTEGLGRILHNAGLPKIRAHDLRHTAATLAAKHGMHPKRVQEMLGHASIAITLDLYSHHFEGIHDEIADTMDAIFTPKLSTKLSSS